jgi:hypothetical protein
MFTNHGTSGILWRPNKCGVSTREHERNASLHGGDVCGRHPCPMVAHEIKNKGGSPGSLAAAAGCWSCGLCND